MLPRPLTCAPRPRIDSGNGQCSSTDRVRHRVVSVLLADDSKMVNEYRLLRDSVPPSWVLPSIPRSPDAFTTFLPNCSRAVFHLTGHRRMHRPPSSYTHQKNC